MKKSIIGLLLATLIVVNADVEVLDIGTDKSGQKFTAISCQAFEVGEIVETYKSQIDFFQGRYVEDNTKKRGRFSKVVVMVYMKK